MTWFLRFELDRRQADVACIVAGFLRDARRSRALLRIAGCLARHLGLFGRVFHVDVVLGVVQRGQDSLFWLGLRERHRGPAVGGQPFEFAAQQVLMGGIQPPLPLFAGNWAIG